MNHQTEQPNDHAMYIPGDAYDYGNRVPIDYAMALSWYRKAAEKGNSFAQHEFKKRNLT